MASFFEKLKKGMGIEEPIAEPEEDEENKLSSSPAELPKETKVKKKVSPSFSPFAAARVIEAKTSKRPKKSLLKSPQDYPKQAKKLEIQTEQPEVEKDSFFSTSAGASVIKEQVEKETPVVERFAFTMGQAPKESKKQKEKKWLSFDEEEGQLAIDVYQTENDLVIQSAIAGIKPENLDISIEKDIIIIKGKREKPYGENGDYFTQECFWGHFSREVIMPAEVDSARAAAEMKNGILTIRIPKVLREKKRTIIVKG